MTGDPRQHPPHHRAPAGHATAGRAPSGHAPPRPPTAFHLSRPLPLSFWTWPGAAVVAWAAVALVGGVLALLYLGLGTIMTNTLDGVFSPDDPGLVANWVMLLIALIGQLLGLGSSVLVLVMAIRDRRRAERRAKAAFVLGIIAVSLFLLIGVIQLPLMGIFFDALPLMTA